MLSLVFATGNAEKFAIAQAACQPLGIELLQQQVDIHEIQAEDGETVIKDKVQRAFEAIQKPLVVSDDSWSIPGLRGFPGPYMKSMDHWFTPEDVIHLTTPLKDRRIILIQLLAYKDASREFIIRKEHEATLLPEARGNYGKPWQKVIAMPGDNGLSIAEVWDKGPVHSERDSVLVWQALAKELLP